MAGRHEKPDTALQNNHSFTAVDDFDTRMYILEFIADKSKREALIAEHREAPRGAGTRPIWRTIRSLLRHFPPLG